LGEPKMNPYTKKVRLCTLWVRVCECVCVCEREREGERGRERESNCDWVHWSNRIMV
jgi:hypothetical protein